MSSRALKSGRSGRGTALASNSHQERSITVVRSTTVNYDHKANGLAVNKTPFENSLETTSETTSEHRAWSPTPSREHLTRPSSEHESIPMQSVWKDPGRERWIGRS